MQQAYTQAVREAQYEHGHSPYSGSIGTTCGCFRAVPQALTRVQARRIVDKYWEFDCFDPYQDGPSRKKQPVNPIAPHRIEKWGAAAAIEVKPSRTAAGQPGNPGGWLFFGLAAT